MKLNITINNRQHHVELQAGASPLVALLDGTRHELTLHTPPPSNTTGGERTYLVTVANRVYECAVSKTGEGEMEMTIGGQVYTAHVSDPRALPTGGIAGIGASGRARITAPMPGKIVRVLVEQGAQVAAGDGLLVVEAMKMQNEMKATKSGTVIEMHVEVGATVAAGDVLVTIE